MQDPTPSPRAAPRSVLDLAPDSHRLTGRVAFVTGSTICDWFTAHQPDGR